MIPTVAREAAVGVSFSTPTHLPFSCASLASRLISLESDDVSLFSDFFVAFGGHEPTHGEPPDDEFLRIAVEAPGPDRSGRLRLWHNGTPMPIDRFFFGLTLPDCPYVRLPSPDPNVTTIAFRGHQQPQFVYSGTECEVLDSTIWRPAIIALVLRGFLSLCTEAIFFHASSIGIDSKGFFFVGTQHSGKSTLALALASRGHEFLSDDIGCYIPAEHVMLPYRRPVGIREGPCAAAISEALRTRAYRSIRQDDSIRVDPSALLDLSAERPIPVSGVVFLRGFGRNPILRRIEAGREELSAFQTLYSSLTNAPPAQRLLELIRLTSRARMFELVIGNPDETALYVEEVLSS